MAISQSIARFLPADYSKTNARLERLAFMRQVSCLVQPFMSFTGYLSIECFDVSLLRVIHLVPMIHYADTKQPDNALVHGLLFLFLFKAIFFPADSHSGIFDPECFRGRKITIDFEASSLEDFAIGFFIAGKYSAGVYFPPRAAMICFATST
jgi:hypothetical protein